MFRITLLCNPNSRSRLLSQASHSVLTTQIFVEQFETSAPLRTFISVLIESSEGVYLVVSNVCDGGIHQAGGLGTDGGDHRGPVALDG